MNITKLYRCPKGHETSAVFRVIVDDNSYTLDIMPYEGNYCFVCFSAWLAKNVPRTVEVFTSDEQPS